jgi:hypothetical protein
MKTGYLDIHADHYNHTTYTIRSTKYYNIIAGFPRLLEEDIPGGINDVRFSVDITACSRFIIKEKYFLEKLRK